MNAKTWAAVDEQTTWQSKHDPLGSETLCDWLKMKSFVLALPIFSYHSTVLDQDTAPVP